MTMSIPFADFNPKTADSILDLAEGSCTDEVDAACHLAAALFGLTGKKGAHMLIDVVDAVGNENDEFSNAVMEFVKCQLETTDDN
jgi:hypothetical protein